ncbi:hypothetical protein CNMCM5793_001625 [Aspergillus hiratsukae]|uniref:Uncharacterized protein n=1 Tax=Aspergillus hiratsukae TaxID=1194566 RepID=A0A8H6Q3G1_9EURO|nr:hypothetical protein CNMCM5793_001625 [Aspergillus hiratsukae]KAF7165154.1 hypothetical protein CNMCM6106_001394 [Aspergillus hiratsukae]
MSTAIQHNASMHVPAAASGSGGRRPDRGNGGRRPPDRGPGNVTKKTKKKKWCRGCQRWGHTLSECRSLGNAVLATARALAAESSHPPVSHRHPLGPRQQRPRMEGPNSRERREARRLAEGLWQPQRQERQAQEQQGRQEQAPQEQLPQHHAAQEQRPRPSASSPMRLADQDPNTRLWLI